MFWRYLVLGIALGLSVVTHAESEDPDSDELYYIAEEAYASPSIFELQVSGGYDFSNPYLHNYSAHAAILYLPFSTLGVGIEGAKYTSSKRANLEALEAEVGPYGFDAHVFKPDWQAGGVIRYTPISGRVNFLATQIINADVSLALRGGMVKYETLPPGPAVGVSLGVHLGFTSAWGLLFQTVWDMDKPDNNAWQSRVGMRLGPTFKF